MLNTKKLLYIVPELAYVAELLPTKKPNTFTIQSFRQINGEFMTDNEFLTPNLQKLFSKLEDTEEYHLVLPDYLFTNTIISIEETSDAKIKSYLKEKLLPSLELSEDTHELETFVLTEFKNVSKVQISAIEKTLLSPLRVVASQRGIKISGISPLSWTLKSVISLEPSISVLQIGSMLYTALHYIGIDQTTAAPLEELDNITETIKTLKGAEPSIQTVYLLGNAVVEDHLKEAVSSTLPIQQLTTFKEEDTQMPSYVRHIIESGMKTLSIPDYPVPKFDLGKASEDEVATVLSLAGSGKAASEETEDATDEEVEETTAVVEEPEEALEAAAGDEPAEEPEEETEIEDEPESAEPETEDLDLPQPGSDDDEVLVPPPVLPTTIAPLAAASVASVEDTEDTVAPETEVTDLDDETEEPAEPATPPEATEIPPAAEAPTIQDEAPEPTPVAPPPPDDTETAVDLSQFTHPSDTPASSTAVEPPPTHVAAAPVVKPKSGIQSMLKMIFITIAVFFATVAIGVGVGLGILQLSNRSTTIEESPVVVESPLPSPSPTTAPSPSPSASPSATLNKKELSILVVNATTKPGYAGTTRSKLVTAGYGTVTAGNAKDKYDPGTYVLMAEENADLMEALETDSGLDLELETDTSVEDASKQYDAIIVLAE